MSKIYKESEGIIITIDLQEDISGATANHSIDILFPDGTSTDWIGSISGNTYVYTTQAGDLDQVGKYSCNVYLEIGTWKGRAETVYLDIYDNFK